MFYTIGSISNRDIQLLYEYRILREPSDNLSAICREGTPQTSDKLDWIVSSRTHDDFDVIYEATLDNIKPIGNCVPFLEFHPDVATDWKWISDFIDIEVTETELKIYSSTNHLTKLTTQVYWCYSLRHIDALLTDIFEHDLKRLTDEYDNLEESIKNYKDTGRYLTRPEGLTPNLVQITAEESGLKDSLYRIMTADRNRLFVNYPQATLDVMEHIFNESVEFRFLDRDHYVLDSFITPILLVSGTGDLVLKNIHGQVLITDWNGTVTVIDCPEVHLTATDYSNICRLTRLQIDRGSTVYLENQVHIIGEVRMLANSICRHWRGNVQRIDYVGPGCTYWCSAQVSVPGRVQLQTYEDTSNTVFDFNLHDIIGAFISDFDNMMIIGQKNLTPRLGNSDAEPSPTIYVASWNADYNH